MATKNSVLQIIVTLLAIFLPVGKSIKFNYPAVFNFGDSNSDTGEMTAGRGWQLPLPYGQTYFKPPSSSGRFSDGRLLIDFLSKFILILTHHMPYRKSILNRE